MTYQWHATYNENNRDISIDRTLPPGEDGRGYKCEIMYYSIECLFTDGREIYMGACHLETDEIGGIEWIEWMAERDCVIIENVTHWGYLPDLPQE